MRFLMTAALIASAGCSSVKSEDVYTDALYANLTAISDGDGTRAEAVLRVGGAASTTYVQLTGGDTITVTGGAESSEMTETNLGNLYGYVADLAVQDEDTEFLFDLERTLDDGAPNSTCTLPAPLEILSPADGDSTSRGAASLTVTWDPSGENDDLLVSVSGDCFSNVEESVAGDPGTYTFEPGTLESFEGSEDETCSGTVTVLRKRAGTLDPGYGEGGEIYCGQQRTVDITVAP